MAIDVWKLLDEARIDSPNEGGTAVVFAYEALAKRVGDAVTGLESDLHTAIVEAREHEERANAADHFILKVDDGYPGEIDICDREDGHSHRFVPTSELESLTAEIHRMRVQLGGLKGWCERNGHNYALSLVLAALGPTTTEAAG